jgi:hypothetical protein
MKRGEFNMAVFESQDKKQYQQPEVVSVKVELGVFGEYGGGDDGGGGVFPPPISPM